MAAQQERLTAIANVAFSYDIVREAAQLARASLCKRHCGADTALEQRVAQFVHEA